MSFHLQFKSRFASQAFLPLYNSPLHITATLSISLSLSCPSLAVHLACAHSSKPSALFPSQHLNKSIYATSHAYETCQLTNGGQVEQ